MKQTRINAASASSTSPRDPQKGAARKETNGGHRLVKRKQLTHVNRNKGRYN